MALYVVKDRVWDSIEYNPHGAQRLVHDSDARHRVMAGGRRIGKSTIGGTELVPEAVLTYSMLSHLQQVSKKRRFWLVGPDYTDSEKEFRVLYDYLKKQDMPFDRPGTYNNPDQGDLKISLWDGAFQVEGKSARYHESLDGEGLCGVELVEAAKLKSFIWGKYIRPALADERGWSLQTSTPEGKNWFYRHYLRGQDPKFHSWASWRMPAWRNDVIYPGGRDDPEIQDMKKEMSAERFNQQVAAMFTDFVGRVFKDFEEEMHVRDLIYRPDLPLFGACDYGFTNPFVWLVIQVDVWDNVYVLAELRRQRKDINDIARDLDSWTLAKNAREFFPDPAEPGDTVILEKKLRVPANHETGGELKHRLDLIREHLKFDPSSEGHPDEKREPKLFINRSCTELIQEMLDYRYPDTAEEAVRAPSEAPMDKDDHGPEALGRFFRGYFGPPEGQPTQGRAVVRRAVIRSGSR